MHACMHAHMDGKMDGRIYLPVCVDKHLRIQTGSTPHFLLVAGSDFARGDEVRVSVGSSVCVMYPHMSSRIYRCIQAMARIAIYTIPWSMDLKIQRPRGETSLVPSLCRACSGTPNVNQNEQRNKETAQTVGGVEGALSSR